MITKLQVLEWEIEFDKDVTAQAYTRLSVGCDCAYCRNFLAICRNLPRDYVEFLNQLGIDPTKPAEIVEYNENHDGTYHYGWWFHVVGRLTKENESIVKFNSEIDIVIRNRRDVAPKDFPRPSIQIEFFSNLPWVLEEQP